MTPGTSLNAEQTRAVVLVVAAFTAIGFLNGFYLPHLHAADPRLYWLADSTHYVVLPAVAAAFLSRRGILPIDYGFRRAARRLGVFEWAFLTVGVCAVFWVAYWPVRLIAGVLAPLNVVQPVLPGGLGIAYMAATAAVLEEAVFRGLPWLCLERWNSGARVPAYVVGSAVLFASIHVEQGLPALIAAFTLGSAAAYTYARLGTLWPLVAAHFALDVWLFAR